MARDLESLVVSLDADITKLTKQLAKAGVNLDDFAKGAEKSSDRVKKAAAEAGEAASKHGADAAAGLSYLEAEVLGHSARATFEALSAGANPLRVLAQEGVKAASVIGDGGITGLVKRLGVSLGGLVSPAVLAGGAVAAVALGGIKAYDDFEAEQQKLRLGLSGIGAASHATVGDIEEIGDTIAKTARVSNAEGRDIALAIAQTGTVDKSQIGDIGGLARGYGALTGQSTTAAGAALAKLFADPAKGAETLNARLAALDGNTLHYIRTLAESGQTQKANQAIINAVGPDLLKAADDVSILTRAYETLKRALAAAPVEHAVGQAIARGVDGPSIDDQIAIYQRALADARQNVPDTSALDDFGGADAVENGQAVIKLLEQQLALLQRTKAAKDAAATRDADFRKAVVQSNAATPAIQEADPQLQAIEHAEAQRALAEKAVENAQNFGTLPEGGYDHAVAAVETYDAKLKELKADYAQGGTAAASAFRQADFQRQTAGLSSYSRGLADINHQYDELIRQAKEAGNLRGVPELEQARGAALAAQQATYLTQPSQYSRSVNDVPDQYRATVLAAAAKSAVDPNLLASLIYQESRFNQGAVSKAGAIGLGQLLPGTAADLGVDPHDATQNIEGAAAYLSQLLAQFHQNVPLALAAYNAGPGRVGQTPDLASLPRETQNYVAAITQQTPDIKQQADAGRDADRAIDDQARSLVNLQTNLGKSNTALAAGEEAQRQESEAVRAGIPLSDALKERIAQRAAAYADLAQKTAGVRLAADLSFQREQIGMSPGQAAVAQQLRGAGIDANSDAGRALAGQIQDIRNISELKDTGSSFAKGLTQDLMAGTRAGQALENQLQRILGKLSDNLIDNLFSNLFSGLLKSGSGGILSSIGGLLTGGALHLAGGGRVVGPGSGTSDSIPAFLSHGEFVMSAASTRKHGALLAALNSGTVLRLAAGGPVDLPTLPIASAPRSAGSVSHQVGISIDARGAQGNAEIEAAITRGVRAGMNAVANRMPKMIASYNARGTAASNDFRF